MAAFLLFCRKALAGFPDADADQDDAYGQYRLGLLSAGGFCLPKDIAAAAEWFRRAAEQGWTDGQVALGMSYAEGQGLPQDYTYAHMWLKLAAAKGNAEAIKTRDNLGERMTPDQIAEAQRLAREWLAVHPKP